MALAPTYTYGFALACIFYILSNRKKKHGCNGSCLPPGPVGLPLIGNILQLDAVAPHKALSHLRRRYGDLFYCRIFGQDTIVISTESIAKALLDKRSTSFSGRPSMNVYNKMGLDCDTGFMGYNDTWRLHRRLYHDAFRRDAVSRYNIVQLRKAHILLDDILGNPEAFEEHLQTFSASVILSVVYGYEATSRVDPLITLVASVDKLLFDNVISFEAVAAELFPFLLRVPAWIPDLGIKKKMSYIRNRVHEALETPYKYTQDALVHGGTGPSMVGDILRKREDKGDTKDAEDALKGAAFTAYTAGAETTTSVLLTFIYLMAVHSDLQERVQVHIDTTIGTTRLPTLEDRQSLPLVDAILRETIRWSPVAPIAVPHSVTEDEVYEGYFIPKGSMVIVNVWEIFHDAAKYVNPEHFNPDHFLRSDGSLTDDISQHDFRIRSTRVPRAISRRPLNLVGDDEHTCYVQHLEGKRRTRK